jgi:hypothetical protein
MGVRRNGGPPSALLAVSAHGETFDVGAWARVEVRRAARRG